MGSNKDQAPLASEPETPLPESNDDTAACSLHEIQVVSSQRAGPKRAPYLQASSIPHTSAARLSEPDVAPTPFPSEPVLAKTFLQNAPVKPKTVLYLAYGSNMCAETFLGMRGIRPLSQVNVSAPSLDLTFDLPGLPYLEPCFANTAIRKIPGAKPPFDPPKVPPELPKPPIQPPAAHDEEDQHTESSRQRSPVWNKGLYGVVYEVTLDDYAKIVATEGGGASYHDILVPCIVLPPSIRVPEKPTIPIPPTPFLAHTLYAPRLPGVPDKDDPSQPKPKPSPKPPNWLSRLLHPVHRPQPDYAQPSARYLKLLRDGAAEHELPADYQAYLASLQPYTITTRRQKLGQALFLGFWLPFVALMIECGKWFADDKGKSPAWVVVGMTAVMNLMWGSYDCVGKRVFLDGERTIEEGGEGDEVGKGRGRPGIGSGLRGKEEVVDEEKKALMDGCR
jgi:hypothetical protein